MMEPDELRKLLSSGWSGYGDDYMSEEVAAAIDLSVEMVTDLAVLRKREKNLMEIVRAAQKLVFQDIGNDARQILESCQQVYNLADLLIEEAATRGEVLRLPDRPSALDGLEPTKEGP